jgi:photosystem II stability/assembly factor-like uncharacterized protein
MPAITGAESVQALAVDPRTANTMFAGTRRGIFRSRDGGDSWQLVATAPGAPPAGQWGVAHRDRFQAIAIDPLDPETVYAGLRTDGIFKSSDGGDTWVASESGLIDKRIKTLAVDPRDPQIVYVSTGGGVFRSTDGARSWHSFGRGLTADVAAFAIDPAGRTIYAGTEGDGVAAGGTSR